MKSKDTSRTIKASSKIASEVQTERVAIRSSKKRIAQQRDRMKIAKARLLENRKDLRVPIQLKVDVEYPSEHYLFEFSSNLSQNGIFIHTQDPLEPGTEVNIQFDLPDRHRIRTRGLVIWVNDGEVDEPGMGVKFVGLIREDRERILSAIRKLAIL